LPKKTLYLELRVKLILGGEIVQNTKNWQDFIDESDAKLLEDRLSEIMNRLNYSRYTSL
jgi:hypothetical protein